jgi:uncharacterized membrane protein YtjA (UPF0391 family)
MATLKIDFLAVRRSMEVNYFTIKTVTMLRWTLVFLVVAIIAGIFGFGGIYAAAAGIAKFLFFLCIVLFVISLILKSKP